MQNPNDVYILTFSRQPLSSHGKYLAQTLLHLSPGTFLSSYVQLYMAFLLSGFFHAAAQWMMSHSLQRTISMMWFFIAQALAISAEDLVIAIAKRLGVRQVSILSSVVGISWVISWTAWSGPFCMEPLILGGVMEDGPPISLFEALAKYRS